MGISIEQYRAQIGTFAARKCSMSEESCSPIVLDNNQDSDIHSTPVVMCSISWKSASLGILLILLCALCHSQLLLIGGVESNPGPQSVDDILAALSVGALNTNIRDCIRLYRKEATTTQHKKAFSKCDKNTLVETMNYLNVPNQDEYTKESVINNLIVRIQNLLPDMCRMCHAEYCMKLEETAVVSCSLCGQSAHNECIAQKMGMDCELLEELDLEESRNRINPLGIPGLHYICGACEENVIPSTEAGKLRRRKNTVVDTNEETVFQSSTGDMSNSQDENNTTDPPPSQLNNETDNLLSMDDHLNETNHLSQTSTPPSPSQTGATPPQAPPNTARGICSFYRRGTCRFGMTGKGCPKEHPKACRKLTEHGNRGPRGCNKGKNCESFHPRMCPQSLSAGECLTLDCRLRHVAGTKRDTTKGRARQAAGHHDRHREHQHRSQGATQDSQRRHKPKSTDQVDFLELLNAMRTEIMAAMENKMTHLSQLINTAQQTPQNSANQASPMIAWQTAIPYQNQALGPWQVAPQHQQVPPHPTNVGQVMYRTLH